jgi:hypothetical protein
MNEAVDTGPSPSLMAYGIAHLLIGLLVGALTKIVFKQSHRVAAVAGLIAMGMHYSFDAPLARTLSALEDLAFNNRNAQLQNPPPG